MTAAVLVPTIAVCALFLAVVALIDHFDRREP